VSYTLEFQLDGLPRMTNPSGRGTHWRVIKQERDKWKMAVIAVAARWKPATPLTRARLTLTRCSTTQPDPDGLVSGFKAIVDGLVRAGVLEDDKGKNIGFPDYRWEKAPRGKGCVRVKVEEIKL
jgi:Holliday junction resolvase RusA-like endonuclease